MSDTPKKRPVPHPDRRAVLGGLLAAGVASIGASAPVRTPPKASKDPRERDLDEADLFGPHDLAG